MAEVRFEELISSLMDKKSRALEREWRSIKEEVLKEVGLVKGPIMTLFNREGVSTNGKGINYL